MKLNLKQQRPSFNCCYRNRLYSQFTANALFLSLLSIFACFELVVYLVRPMRSLVYSRISFAVVLLIATNCVKWQQYGNAVRAQLSLIGSKTNNNIGNDNKMKGNLLQQMVCLCFCCCLLPAAALRSPLLNRICASVSASLFISTSLLHTI